MDVGFIIKLPETFDFSIKSINNTLDERVPKMLRRDGLTSVLVTT